MDGSVGILFAENESKVLLVKRRDIPIWVLPGGGIEPVETPYNAAIREIFEETGFHAEVIRKTAEYKYPSGKITHVFECKVVGGVKTLSKESKEIEYFNVNNLPNMISPYIHEFIEDAIKHNQDLIVKPIKKIPLSYWIKGISHPWALFKYLLTLLGIHWNT